MYDSENSISDNAAIVAVWRRLPTIRRLVFSAVPGPGSATGWQGRGEARVAVTRSGDALRFFENGIFRAGCDGAPVSFRNVYRWQYRGDRLSLYHERFGADAAVWLFDLVADASTTLYCAAPHRCGDDAYRAALSLDDQGFSLRWAITGPRKDETLNYAYRC